MSPSHIFSEHTFCILNKAHDCAAVVDQIGPPHIVRFCHSKTLNIQVQSLHYGALSSAAGRTGASTLQRFVQFDAVRTGKRHQRFYRCFGPPVNKWQFTGHQYQIPFVWATTVRYSCRVEPPCQHPSNLASITAFYHTNFCKFPITRAVSLHGHWHYPSMAWRGDAGSKE